VTFNKRSVPLRQLHAPSSHKMSQTDGRDSLRIGPTTIFHISAVARSFTALCCRFVTKASCKVHGHITDLRCSCLAQKTSRKNSRNVEWPRLRKSDAYR